MTMRAAVLFSGIGGWEIACANNGVEVVWSAEWDEWKRARYLERWPDAHLLKDVAEIDGRQLVRERGPIDLLLASPPCTDISAANHNGAGIDGNESRYYLEAIRLARETGVRWIGFENSPRLRTRGADRVLTLLDEARYAVWPCVVEAEDAGAPHERGRSFVLGCRRDALEGSDAQRTRLWIEQGWRRWQDRHGAAESSRDAGNATCNRPVQAPERGGSPWGQQAYGGSRNEENADADSQGQPHSAEHAEMGWRPRVDGNPSLGSGEAADVDGEHRRHRTGREDGAQAGNRARPTPCNPDRQRLAERQGVGRNPFEKFTAAERAALCPWDHGGDGLAGYLPVAHGMAERLRGHGLSDRAVKAELARWRSALGDALVIPVVTAVVRAIVRTDHQWGPRVDESNGVRPNGG